MMRVKIRELIDRIGFVGVSGSLLLSGLVQGFGVLSFRVEIAFVVVVVVLLHAILSSVTFTIFIALSGLLFGIHRLNDYRSSTVQEDGPSVVAIVPVYQDAAVLDRSVRSILASPYQNLSVWIACEPDDSPSLQRAASLAGHDRVNRYVNTNEPTSKAAAINQVVKQTDSEYVAVFDADEQVNSDFIGHAVASLEHNDTDVVQGRTIPEPTGVIEELAYYESVLLSYIGRRLLYLGSDFRMASSRAVVMDRDAFERVGGYDPEMLTEDFDFAYRCYTDRVDVMESLAYPSRIEAAHSLRDWWGQRKRWMIGYAQVLHRLLARIDPTDYRGVVSVAICAGTVIGSGLMITLLSKFFVLLLVGAEVWFLLPVGVVSLLALSCRVHDWWTNNLDSVSLYWLVTPVLLPMYGLASLRAVFEYLFTWDGEWYIVEKTASCDGNT